MTYSLLENSEFGFFFLVFLFCIIFYCQISAKVSWQGKIIGTYRLTLSIFPWKPNWLKGGILPRKHVNNCPFMVFHIFRQKHTYLCPPPLEFWGWLLSDGDFLDQQPTLSLEVSFSHDFYLPLIVMEIAAFGHRILGCLILSMARNPQTAEIRVPPRQ